MMGVLSSLIIGALPWTDSTFLSKMKYLTTISLHQYFEQSPLNDCSPHQYKTVILSQDPCIIYIASFLSSSEISHLLDLG